jgi:UDP-glucose 4-epimerase
MGNARIAFNRPCGVIESGRERISGTGAGAALLGPGILCWSAVAAKAAKGMVGSMKLLVTGGAGYIGSVVTRSLVEAGHEVVVLDDLSTGFADNVPDEAEFHEMSLHEVARVLTPAAAFNGVLHFAGKIAVAESVARPDLYWHVNVGGTMALLDAIRAAGVPRLVFSSTGSMYVSQGTDKLTEEAPVLTQNPYASTKLTVDLMLSGECAAFGLGAASLRYFNASGAVDSLGERHTPETHLIPVVLEVAGGRRDELLLYGDDYPTPDGTCIRDYIHVADLATAHLLALDDIKPARHEIYNLGNGDGYSNLQVIEAAREVTGHPIPVKLAPRRAGDPAASVSDSTKAYRELGWRPTKPELHQIIADAWAFHSSVW